MAIPTITHNTPSAGYISWGAFTIQLNGVAYAVPAASSNQRWVWWEYKNGAPIINAGPDVPSTLTDDDLVLFANKNGIGVRVQSSNFVDGELLVDGSIFADALSTNLINSQHIVTAGLDAGVIKFGVMSGDRIQVNTLQGDRILANTIGVSKLIVSDFNNYVADGDLVDPTMANWGTGLTRTDVVGDVAYMEWLTAANSNAHRYNLNFFEVRPGDEFYFYCEVSTPSTNTVPVNITAAVQTTDGDGAVVTWPQASPAVLSPNTGWTVYEGSFTVPTGNSRRAQWNPFASSGATAGQAIRMRNMFLQKKGNGKLIVDGSINTNHVITTGLDAKVITFGTMSGDRITAKTINTGHIVTTGLDAGVITFGTMSGDRIVAKSINSGHIVTDGLDAGVITFGTMSGDRIDAKSIGAEQLKSDVILASQRIAALGSAGQSVELNQDGFFVYGPTSEGNPAYVSFPTEGGTGPMAKPNIISGTLQATTLSVEGNPTTGQSATFRQNSQFEPGATLTLNDSTVAPISAPTLQTVVNEALGTAGMGVNAVGATYHAPSNCIYTISSESASGGGYQARVLKWDLSNNVITNMFAVKYGTRTDLTPRGIAYFNGQFHIGWQEAATNKLYVARYDTTTVPGQWFQNTGVDFGVYNWTATIGTDGTDLWIADMGTSQTANLLRFRRFTGTSLSTTVQETVQTSTGIMRSSKQTSTSNANIIYSFNVGNFDFGARKFVLTYNTVYQNPADPMGYPIYSYDMMTFGTTGARETANEFELMRKIYGANVVWNGSIFVGATSSGSSPYIQRYSNIRSTTGRTMTLYGASSFYRSTDGSETLLSPFGTLTMNSRWYWKSTQATPPSGSGSRVYISTATGQANSHLQSTLATGVTSVTLGTYDAAGAVGKAVSTFGSSTPAILQSQQTITQSISVTSSATGSTTFTGTFAPYMVGRPISGGIVPAGTTVVSVAANNASAVFSAGSTGVGTSTATLVLPKLEIRGNGYARISELERVIITSTDDVTATAGNQPALRIGNIAGAHMRMDANEIQAMGGDASTASLILNQGGGTVTIGSSSAPGTLNMAGAGGLTGVQSIGGNGGTTSLTAQTSVIVDTLADGATSNSATGAKYVRANTNGRLYASTTAPSSRKIKTNITPMPSDRFLDAVMKLEPKWAAYKEAPDDIRAMVIAEEAHDLGLTNLVGYEDGGKNLGEPTGFDYDGLTVVLLKIIQNQDKRIENQDKRIAALEARGK
jgi:hypothetical protein